MRIGVGAVGHRIRGSGYMRQRARTRARTIFSLDMASCVSGAAALRRSSCAAAGVRSGFVPFLGAVGAGWESGAAPEDHAARDARGGCPPESGCAALRVGCPGPPSPPPFLPSPYRES